jgi:hypothetical protein
LSTVPDEMFTIEPDPWDRMAGSTAAVAFQTPRTFTAITSSHSCCGMSSSGPRYSPA